jgi:hypothetical protein
MSAIVEIQESEQSFSLMHEVNYGLQKYKKKDSEILGRIAMKVHHSKGGVS